MAVHHNTTVSRSSSVYSRETHLVIRLLTPGCCAATCCEGYYDIAQPISVMMFCKSQSHSICLDVRKAQTWSCSGRGLARFTGALTQSGVHWPRYSSACRENILYCTMGANNTLALGTCRKMCQSETDSLSSSNIPRKDRLCCRQQQTRNKRHLAEAVLRNEVPCKGMFSSVHRKTVPMSKVLSTGGSAKSQCGGVMESSWPMAKSCGCNFE